MCALDKFSPNERTNRQTDGHLHLLSSCRSQKSHNPIFKISKYSDNRFLIELQVIPQPGVPDPCFDHKAKSSQQKAARIHAGITPGVPPSCCGPDGLQIMISQSRPARDLTSSKETLSPCSGGHWRQHWSTLDPEMSRGEIIRTVLTGCPCALRSPLSRSDHN